MELIAARVTDYKSIVDSGWVEIADLTCFVGKNESGKTAFLEALERLNPYDRSHTKFDWHKQYPRKHLESYKLAHEANPATVVRARFRLLPEEVADVRCLFGDAVFKHEQPVLELQKDYKNKSKFVLSVNEEAVVRHLVSSAAFSDDFVEFNLRKAKTLKELATTIQALPGQSDEVRAFLSKHQVYFEGSAACAVYEYLRKFLPLFASFSAPSLMPGKVSLEHVRKQHMSDRLAPAEKLFLALLKDSGIALGELDRPTNCLQLKRKLDSASLAVTREFSRFWGESGSRSIEYEIIATAASAPDVTIADTKDALSFKTEATLHLRIRDNRQRVSFALDEQSRGFIWFISFMAYCKLMASGDRSLIFLLDEPGASLHASGQRDVLKFMEERLLAKGHQILVTSQSQMMERSSIRRLRTVEKNSENGTVIAPGRSSNGSSAQRGQLCLVHSR